MERKLFSLIGALIITLGIKAEAHSAGAPFLEEGLIPRRVLFGNPEKVAPTLSPDGTKIAYLAPRDGVLNIYVAPVDHLEQARPVTHAKTRGIFEYHWAYNNHDLLYLQDENGTEDWCIHRVDVASGEHLRLTPAQKVQAQIINLSPRFPNEIIVALNQRDPRYHDYFHLNIRTGHSRLLLQNEDFLGFLVDDNFRVRGGVKMTEKVEMQYFKPITTQDGQIRWEPFFTIPVEDHWSTQPLEFNEKEDHLYMLDSRDRDTAALVSIDMETGEKEELGSDEKADISGALFHPKTRELQGYQVEYLRKNTTFFDEAMEQDCAYLREIHPGDMSIVSRDLEDKTWIVAFLVDNGPIAYYLFNRAERKVEFLFIHRPELKKYPLARMHSVVIPSRDGLDLTAYLTLPVQADPEETGVPKAPLPLVLLVHGGPWVRDSWGFWPEVQWLANRGYGVLQVNYRGSLGFGKDFVNKANGEWGGKMHDDLLDSVDWAVKEGIADPQKVAIYGGSYGGYAALVGITMTPKVFACGVDIVGVSSLKTLLENLPPYWLPELPSLYLSLGDPRTSEGQKQLAERSPLSYVDRIQRPLLIGHGDHDPRVKKLESDQIVAIMKKKGIPVTYVRYPDEGHGFARPENRLSFYAITEGFLAKFLGGTAEPVGDSFKGSSVILQEGGPHTPHN